MYITLGSQIHDHLDKYDVKKTFALTGTEVNFIVTKASSALSNLIESEVLTKDDIGDDIYATTFEIVLNIYFGTSINTK
jgi:hypothetical protein